ncbi:MAG: valine--tRNA ligase [Candidatus Omnitrophica bacterium]|nr:valine--tRNA ligase [Candidatus Omnitrophota bacterium]
MQSQYEPKKTEEKWYSFWQEKSLFDAKINPKKKPYCIVIPPPNITGILHMGHALNNTIQDVLIRYKRMKGYESLWMPGTDHAGIATQNVVERSLAQEGLRKEDIGRDKFLERLWGWTDEYGSTIINQLKKLGTSCDFKRTRFTMDEGYSEAVKEVFVRLYEKGLIYKGNYIINWCPRCKTALADEEAPHKEIDGWLYYIKYPVKAQGRPVKPPRGQAASKVTKSPVPDYIVVATTRPETMLGDTAVAINPKDKRYKFLKNCEVTLPIIERNLKVVEDNMVEVSFGTGVVKVTPAHDKNDYLMARKHDLEFVNIMRDDAVLNENAAEFAGMDRFEGRQALLEVLQAKGLLDKKEPYKLSAGHCYRCHTIIEPRLSTQWFVRMKPLAKPAIKAVRDNKVRFYPQRWRKVYLNWMQNIEDWCISRQIWWGHRLPVYYCNNCLGQTGSKSQIPKGNKKGVIVSGIRPEKCPECGSKKLVQEEDVLDTWFSSWLWPFATFGWPFNESQSHPVKPPQGQAASKVTKSQDIKRQREEFNYFYPTDVLVTASEILFFWVARMIMAGLQFIGKVPFKDVLIHGTVRDIRGVKMSKSLGNVIDPLEIIDKFGADALRFSLMLLVSSGQDAYLSEEKFLVGRNFANKLWNATRYILSRVPRTACRVPRLNRKDLSLADKWILSELNILIKETTSNFEKFRMDEVAKSIYDFFWHKLCDWYIEISKVEKDKNKENLLIFVLDTVLRLLHPVMPFITEEVWQKINSSKKQGSLMVSEWPAGLKIKALKSEIDSFLALKELIISLRSFKKDLGLYERIEMMVGSGDKRRSRVLKDNLEWVSFLARANIVIGKTSCKESISTANKDFDISLSREFIKDADIHKRKIEKKIEELSGVITSQKNKLSNSSFVKKAPQEVVSGVREKVKVCLDERERLKRIRWS